MLESFPDHCSPHMYGGGGGKSGDEATVNAGIIPRPLLSTYVWGGGGLG